MDAVCRLYKTLTSRVGWGSVFCGASCSSNTESGGHMKLLHSGYGNSGIFMDARDGVLKQKPFRYVVVKSYGGQRGLIGGSFSYEFYGVNSLKELLNQKKVTMIEINQIIDTKTGKEIKKEDIVKQFLKSLTARQKAVLVDEMLINYLAK